MDHASLRWDGEVVMGNPWLGLNTRAVQANSEAGLVSGHTLGLLANYSRGSKLHKVTQGTITQLIPQKYRITSFHLHHSDGAPAYPGETKR